MTVSRMTYLTHANTIITPSPDFTISFEGKEGVMIECPEQRTDNEVLDWIAYQRGGKWIMSIWRVTLGGVERVMPNPHMNNRSLWAYLVRKA